MIKMRTEYDVSLDRYTTFRMGGIAKFFHTAETEEELINLINKLPQPYFCIGGGSNLLINNSGLYKDVVNLREFNKTITVLGKGEYKIGASVRLQKVIDIINKDGYGGIEYLYSVPGLIGGAICMNAGRGRKYQSAISDFLVSVEVWDRGKRTIMTKSDCDFSYRKSIFQNGDYIILSAIFKFKEMDRQQGKELCMERLRYCKKYQDNSKPNYGSVFSCYNGMIMKLFRYSFLGKRNHISFSKKTLNWMLNEDEGKFDDAIALINRIEKLHKLFRLKCEREVIVWD